MNDWCILLEVRNLSIRVAWYSLALSEWKNYGVRCRVFAICVMVEGVRVDSSDRERMGIAIKKSVTASINMRMWWCWRVDGELMGHTVLLLITSAGRRC